MHFEVTGDSLPRHLGNQAARNVLEELLKDDNVRAGWWCCFCFHTLPSGRASRPPPAHFFPSLYGTAMKKLFSYGVAIALAVLLLSVWICALTTSNEPQSADITFSEMLQGECSGVRIVRATKIAGRPGVAVFLRGRWQVDSMRSVGGIEVRGAKKLRDMIRVHTGVDFDETFIRSVFPSDVANVSIKGPESLFFNESFTEVLVVLDERDAKGIIGGN